MQKLKSGFTLVEMLIVVVIIGILSVALLPRLTGHMARTRDLKRQTDLRNIAAAVGMYKNAKGTFPDPGGTHGRRRPIAWNVYRLTPYLQEYLSTLPTDPQKGNLLCIHWQCANYRAREGKIYSFGLDKKDTYDGISRGEYAYQLSYKDFQLGEAAYLIAKTETAEASNYVLTLPILLRQPGSAIGFRTTDSGTYFDPEWLHLCSSIEKGGTAQRIQQADGTYHCTYTDPDQLYYILKVEE